MSVTPPPSPSPVQLLPGSPQASFLPRRGEDGLHPRQQQALRAKPINFTPPALTAAARPACPTCVAGPTLAAAPRAQQCVRKKRRFQVTYPRLPKLSTVEAFRRNKNAFWFHRRGRR